ncbi:MAG TPA: hypothetical protein VNK73_14880 [Actinomycetota bacterium]|jgi:hypothetical protein|nr:hypothetical protein [Actinomycetota bacterium]
MSRSTVPVPTPPRPRRSRLEAVWQRLLRGSRRPLARRLAVTVLLCAAATGLVGLSWATADADPAGARPPVAAKPAGPAMAGEQTPSPRPSPRAAHRRPQPPEAVAAGWYAKRLGVPGGRVRALGSQRLGPGRLRVLVLAQTAAGRQATAWVPLRRTHAGWTVSR